MTYACVELQVMRYSLTIYLLRAIIVCAHIKAKESGNKYNNKSYTMYDVIFDLVSKAMKRFDITLFLLRVLTECPNEWNSEPRPEEFLDEYFTNPGDSQNQNRNRTDFKCFYMKTRSTTIIRSCVCVGFG